VFFDLLGNISHNRREEKEEEEEKEKEKKKREEEGKKEKKKKERKRRRRRRIGSLDSVDVGLGPDGLGVLLVKVGEQVLLVFNIDHGQVRCGGTVGLMNQTERRREQV